MMPPPKNKKKARKSALEKLAAVRRGESAFDDAQEDNDEDYRVYDELDEDEYKQVVQSRRDMDDFVVDDGMLMCRSCEQANTENNSTRYVDFPMQKDWATRMMGRTFLQVNKKSFQKNLKMKRKPEVR